MRILIGITLDHDGAPELLHERLLAWSLHGGYSLAERTPDRWVFRRGSFWGSLFVMWDIYRLPCEVTVLRMPISKQVAAALECTSWFHFATGGDRAKLEVELARLRAMLCDVEPRRGPDETGITAGGPTDIR